MLKLLLIDDSDCKKELASFVKKQQQSVKMISSSGDLLLKSNELLQRLNNLLAMQRRIVVNTTESVIMLNVSDIVRCESNRNYTYIHLSGKKKIIASKTLMEFEEMLNKYNFLRIHKSHLINISYIEKYIKNDGGYILLTDGSRLPVSVRKKDYLFRELERL